MSTQTHNGERAVPAGQIYVALVLAWLCAAEMAQRIQEWSSACQQAPAASPEKSRGTQAPRPRLQFQLSRVC